MKPTLGAVSRGQHQPPKPGQPKMREPLGLAVTVASPCTGCDMSIHSPVAPYLFGDMASTPIFRFTAVPHVGCAGSGSWWRLIPIMTVYAHPPTPPRRWWQRKASA